MILRFEVYDCDKMSLLAVQCFGLGLICSLVLMVLVGVVSAWHRYGTLRSEAGSVYGGFSCILSPGHTLSALEVIALSRVRLIYTIC